MNTLYISTTFSPNNSRLYKVIKLCEKNHINSIEIGSIHNYESNYYYLFDFRFNYLVHNYFPIPKNTFVLNIASLDEDIRRKSIEHVKRAIDFTSYIGAHLYTFHPGFINDPASAGISEYNYDFLWESNQISQSDYNRAKNKMYNAIDNIIKYASSKSVKIAIETEGSFNKKDHLLMQRPEEYQEFIDKFSQNDIGINLNIGHLNLAANAFSFKKAEFIDFIQDYIVAMELSHNNGLEDEHLPLKKNGWYWPIINDVRFKNIYKILEFRNVGISDILDNIKLFQE